MSNKWIAAHANPQGVGDSRPTALQIIQDEGLEGKWLDKVVVVTGTSGGIGIETVRALALTGARVICTVRDLQKGRGALGDMLDSKRVELVEMDNNSLQSVRRAASVILERSGGRVNVLICNAAVMATPYGKTADGFETQWGVNYLSHYLLFQLLKDAMLASTSALFNSRLVVVSSSGHQSGSVNVGNYGFDDGATYSPFLAYGQSKTAMIWMANYVDRSFGGAGLHATSLMPGGIATNLQTHMSDDFKKFMSEDPNALKIMKSPAQGASTTIYCATSKDLEGRGGRYFEDCHEAEPVGDQPPNGHSGYMPWAYNPPEEEKVWTDSIEMVRSFM